MKIAVIGYSGCGKSTLARFLGEHYDICVLHLDRVHWLPGWKERAQSEKQEIVRSFLDDHGAWVIDGNYSNLFFERRLFETDQIVLMRFCRLTCLWRAVKRYFAYRGRTRESMTEGCPEKIDLEFIWWILYKGRSRKQRDNFTRVPAQYPAKTIVIKNQRQLTAYMRSVENGAPEADQKKG